MKQIKIQNLSDLNKHQNDDWFFFFPEKTDVILTWNIDDKIWNSMHVDWNLIIDMKNNLWDTNYIYWGISVNWDLLCEKDLIIDWYLDCVNIKCKGLHIRKSFLKCRSIECSKLYARDGINAWYIDIK